jgi:hypothetical protein
MFGMMEAMLSFLRRQIGLRTDSASVSGSLHAKIGDLKNTVSSLANTIMSTLQKPRGNPVLGSFHFNAGSGSTTVLDITGRGQLLSVWLQRYASSGGSVKVRVYIDEVLVSDGEWSFVDSEYGYPVNWLGSGASYIPKYGQDVGSGMLNIPFKSRLKVVVSDANNGGLINWAYALE